MSLIEEGQRQYQPRSSPSRQIPPPGQHQQSLSQQLQTHKTVNALSRLIVRRYRSGDIFAPHDLSPTEMSKWRARSRPVADAFDVLCMDPLEQYKNYSIMAEYVTPMGRLMHSRNTGLGAKNQRRVSRAVRRLVGLGLAPAVYAHPEILQKKAARIPRSGGGGGGGGGGGRRGRGF